MSSEHKKKHLRGMLSDSLYAAFGTNATHILALFITMVLTRKLSVESYGLYSFMLATYGMATMILSLGIQPIIERYLPEILARQDKRAAVKLQLMAAAGHLGIALLISLLAWIFRAQIAEHFHVPEFPQLLPWFVLFTLFKFEAIVFEQMLTAHRSQKYRNLVLTAFQAVKLSLFFFALPKDGSVSQVMSFLVLSNLLLLIAFLGRVLGLNRRLESIDQLPLPARRMLRYGLLRYVSVVTMVAFMSDIDVWFITFFLEDGIEVAGIYRLATKAANMMAHLVPTAYLLYVIVPVYVKEYTRNKDKNQLVRVFLFYNKVVTGFLAPTLIGALILAEPMMEHIFDPKFLAAALPFRIFFVGMFFHYFFNTSSFLLVVLERPEITLYSRVFIIYNIVMDIILIPHFGAAGAAMATGSAMAFGYLFTYLMIKRHVRIHIPWKAVLRIFFYGGLMALVVWPLRNHATDIKSLLLVIMAGAVIYGVLAWRFPFFNNEERVRLNTALGRSIFKVSP